MTASFVGLDIGSSGIRAALVKRHRGEVEISRAASIDLPEGSVSNGIVGDPKAVVSALKKLWRHGRFGTRRVAFALSDSGVLTRQVDLPWMPPTDFATALRYQIGDALPVDLATVELDYHLLTEIENVDDIGNPMPVNRILVVAANRTSTEDEAHILRQAGLEPISADSSAFALIRAACRGEVPTDDRVSAIADIGADQLTVVIHQNGQPLFLRTIANLGGHTATLALAERLSMEPDLAEQVKRETGLNGPAPVVAPIAESSVFGNGGDDAPIDPRVLATVGILNPWATTIVSEIRNSLDYYQASGVSGAITSLTLTGRTMLLDGLMERIATQIPLPVAPMDPLMGMTASNRVQQEDLTDSRMAVAVGMALAVRP